MADQKKKRRKAASAASAARVAKPRKRGAGPTRRPAAVRERARGRGMAPAPIVVGIGASAGGLEAFKKFLNHMPADSGMAFVLVPHLDPKHKSLMAELLSRQTTMVVGEAEHQMPLEPDHVYVIPPNKDLSISRGRLQLSTPSEPRLLRTAIDAFFGSLAREQQERAIGIILSGTGSHGTQGIREIKLAGGMVMVQDPTTAEYDQMPRSAIATGTVDFVLAPEAMPAALVKYVEHPYLRLEDAPPGAPERLAEVMTRVLALLRTRARYDFRCYRKKTLLRRMQRRMGLRQINDFESYLEFLRESAGETEALAKDLLIGVTSFFREPEAFELLRLQVLSKLFARGAPDEPIRVWVAGCATGEEAYSVGMLLLEEAARAGYVPAIQVFATDLNEEALAVGRHGIYPETIAPDVGADRLHRFFTRVDDHRYQVVKQLRDIVVFARQNLIADPPFTRLQLISCRNLLIYMEPEVQQKVISLFHFALGEGGYLFLGSQESIGRQVDLFESLSKRWRIFRRIGETRRGAADIPILEPVDDARPGAAAPARARRVNLADLAQRLLLHEFAPAAVVINRKYEILYLSGPTSEFLELPTGEPTRDLIAMAHPGFRSRVRAVCHRAMREHVTVVDHEARIVHGADGRQLGCVITVKPITEPKELDGLFLVTFEPRPDSAPTPTPAASGQPTAVGQLEYELKATREDLQNTIEELESANEELKASNEEIMSMNEELQSANEELETSKEELQSMNEELSTVNNQLQERIEEREKITNDLTNLVNSTEIATVFLDTTLCVKLFTPPTARLLNLLPSDIGRPLRDLAPKFHDRTLLNDCAEVLTRLVPHDQEVATEAGRRFLRRIVPYRTADNRIEGVVITFVDLTERLERETQTRRLAAVLQQSNDAIVLYDLEGRVIRWSRGAQRMYGYDDAEGMGLNLLRLTPAESQAEMRRLLEATRRGEDPAQFEMQRVTKDGRILTVLMTIMAVRDEHNVPVAIATTAHDVTERRRQEQEIRRLNQELERRITERTEQLRERESLLAAVVDAAADAIIAIDEAGTMLSFNFAAERMFGWPAREAIRQDFHVLISPRPGDRRQQLITRELLEQVEVPGHLVERTGRRRDGSEFPVELGIHPVPGQRIYTVILRDISLRKEMEASLQRIAEEQRNHLAQELHDGLGAQLAGLGMLAEALRKGLERASSPETERATEVVRHLDQSRDQLRRITQGLMPVEVTGAGLIGALHTLAYNTEVVYPVRCTLRADGPPTVGDAAAAHLYYIAREAVVNAARHGKPKRITVTLGAGRMGTRLTVEDDGSGLGKQPKAPGGTGTRIMEHRARSIGAALEIRPRPRGGVIVTCTIPPGRDRTGAVEPPTGARPAGAAR
jgi:two-component system CheB/CheR fusion protein